VVLKGILVFYYLFGSFAVWHKLSKKTSPFDLFRPLKVVGGVGGLSYKTGACLKNVLGLSVALNFI